jgi:hypothetical protein
VRRAARRATFISNSQKDGEMFEFLVVRRQRECVITGPLIGGGWPRICCE